jgi:hypothetical protein
MSLNNNTVGIISFSNANADGARIHGNDITGNLLFGAPGSPPAQRNTIRDNTTLDNALVGIVLGAFTEAFLPSDNLIESNTSFGNGTLGLREGIFFQDPSGDCLNTWMDNDFEFAGPDCVE